MNYSCFQESCHIMILIRPVRIEVKLAQYSLSIQNDKFLQDAYGQGERSYHSIMLSLHNAFI
jgi:hypothetical protein